jgi:hypothetical protein
MIQSLPSGSQQYVSNHLTTDTLYPHRQHLAAKVRVFIDALAKLFADRNWLDPEGAAHPD